MNGDQSASTLPEDIIVGEILLKLPIKPLFRLKCVSKWYNSIISRPKFARNYLQHAYSSCKSESLSGLLSALLFPFTDVSPDQKLKNLTDTEIDYCAGQSFHLRSVSLPHDNMSHKILGSSNGLVLSAFNLHQDEDNSRFGLCVSNPLTKQCVQLPRPTIATRFNQSEYVIATRRERASSAFLSYKIVVFRLNVFPYVSEDLKNTVQIFSSDTGSWAAAREVRCPRAIVGRYTWKGGFVHKGVFHWLDRGMGTVITYDPFDSPDQFGYIQLPTNKRCSESYLVYSGDREMVKYCELHRCFPIHQVSIMSMWRLVDGEWCLEQKFEICSSVTDLTMRLLVAPNPWKRHLICYPYVGNLRLVPLFDCRNIRRAYAKVLLGSKHEKTFERWEYKGHPLILIETCPWSSPFYAQVG